MAEFCLVVELAQGGFVTNGAPPSSLKLDGVGSVDNRPSTDKLQHFVQKKNQNQK